MRRPTRSRKKLKTTALSNDNRAVARIASGLYVKGERAFAEVYKLKSATRGDTLFHLFPKIFKNKNDLEFAYGPAFPAKLSDLFSEPALFKPASEISEVIWAICRCLQFGQELREFTRFRVDYERSLLLDKKFRANTILDDIRSKYGYSIWLLQNELATIQTWEGIEQARKLTKEHLESCKSNWVISFIIWFISRRTEATGLKGHLTSEYSRFVEDAKIAQEIETYLRAKLFELPKIKSKDVSATLFFEAQSCIIDYYETLVAILQSAAKFESIPDELVPLLRKPLAALLKATRDNRLYGIIRSLGIMPDSNIDSGVERAEIIEAYTRGAYDFALDRANHYLDDWPDDMAIQIIRLRSGMREGSPPPYKSGILKDALESLQAVLDMSGGSYSAAYNIFAMSDRFQGHEWANYLTAVVLHELRDDQSEYPPRELRNIYIIDPYTTPFSAVAARGEAKDGMLNDPRLNALFPHTLAVYEAVTTGKIDPSLQISQTRRERYLAIHHLARRNFEQAFEHYQWLMKNAAQGERLRAGGGAALALLKLRRIEEAIDVVVSTFSEHPHVASVLPIREIVDAIDDPSTWPGSISVPILFDMYTTYCDEDKLANLRYAFEKFQQANMIREPSDLAQSAERFGKRKTVLYLRHVWVPKVMRQTILYSGTKEIEEARIKVCRILATLDPDNEREYLDEIRDRVKQLEIAKITTLIQQSKVYVDVEAIKKSLRSKLGDSYTRYKSATLSSPNVGPLLFKTLTEAMTGVADKEGVSVPFLLASMHGIGFEKSTESDAQFEALFHEVTNEFLRGAHGLNAYLSTRVRHGTLSNTLRKPVEDERLITSKEEGSSSYAPNEHWRGDSYYRAEWDEILAALEVFSREFDNVIDYIKDELLQIKIVHELDDKREHNNGLFVYSSSNLERKYVQEQDKSFRSMDDFVDYCVDILWEKTDSNLLHVQETLKGRIRARLMQPFDDLSGVLRRVSFPGCNDLVNAVERARTNTKHNLNLVISWFKRNEVYDRQDYAADFPFHIAHNMVINTMSTAAGWDGVRVETNPDAPPMPGRTLDGMVYVFHVILENAILRSGLIADDVVVNGSISYLNGVFTAKLTNPVARSKVTREEHEKLDNLRESLKSDEYSRRAQREGRSGMSKIWLTINSPVYREPWINFYISDQSFTVEFGFKLEVREDECIDH